MLVLKSLLGRYAESRFAAPRRYSAARPARGRLPDRDVRREELMLVYDPRMLSCFDHGSRGGICRGA